jgi:large-conductance mechanosensitive channel
MSMPTFDWTNIFRGVKSLAVRATFSHVGAVIAVATIVGGILGIITSLINQFVYPLVDLSEFESVVNDLSSRGGFLTFAKYCCRFDILAQFIKVWMSFVFGYIAFLFTTLLTFYVGVGAVKIKQAIRQDTKDL